MGKLNVIFSVYGIVAFTFAVGLLSTLIQRISGNLESGDMYRNMIAGILSLLCFLLSFVFFHIASLRISASHNVLSALIVYIIVYSQCLICTRIEKHLISAWQNPRQTQEHLLHKLLNQNKDTEYGKRYDFNTISSIEAFRKAHPLTKYDHYSDYIDRMSKEEINVLLKKKPPRYGLTSGTTGKGKIIPISQEVDKQLLDGIVYGMTSLWRSVFPQRSLLQKGMYLYTEPTPRATPDGTSLGPLSRMSNIRKYLISLIYSMPRICLEMKNQTVANYVQIVFVLKDRNLGYIAGVFTSRLFSAIRQLEKDWPQMVQDITRGRLNPALDLDNDTREALDKLMEPDQKRADELRREFEKGFQGILRRIWPHAYYIWSIDMTGYRSILEEGYARGLPIYNGMYGSTEAPNIALEFNNFNTGGSSRYNFVLTSAVYEFILEEHIDQEQPASFFIDEVEVGKRYELVITSWNGLCRFRFGDVIKVVDFHYNSPVIEFQYRTGLVLNLRGEKVDSITLHNVITEVISHWPKVSLVDYTCFNVKEEDEEEEEEGEEEVEVVVVNERKEEGRKDLCGEGIDPYYLIFIEIDQEESDTSQEENVGISRQELDMVDEVLCKSSFTYNSFREKGEIAAPRVYLVKPGSFGDLQQHIINNSTATVNQFKNPRKLRSPELVEMMLNRAL
ncbi:uncharacterized protein [Amphiura filiformis]|uniref:uncharacterized protein n=1 Tax=Amphiura filiformis TaxID=82378 RepID=UPI003B2191A0